MTAEPEQDDQLKYQTICYVPYEKTLTVGYLRLLSSNSHFESIMLSRWLFSRTSGIANRAALSLY